MHLIAFVNRSKSNTVTNPIFTDNNKDTEPLECDEDHIYDVIDTCNMDKKQEIEPKHENSSNLYQNFPKSPNKNADSSTIKSNDVRYDQSRMYCTPNPNDDSSTRYNNPISKPKFNKKPTAKPVAKSHHYLPAKKNPPEAEYVEPDVKHATENQYASLDETNKAENQYTSLQQDTVYQGLVGHF